MDEEFKVLLSFVKRILLSSARTDIKKIREEVGATKERVICINVINPRTANINYYYFQVAGDKLKFLNLTHPTGYKGPVDVTLYTNTSVLLNVFEGRQKVLDHASGEIIFAPYTPWDAIRMNDIYGDSNLSISDVKIFLDVLQSEIEEWQKITSPIRS